MRGRGSFGGGWNGQEAADSLCCPLGLSFPTYKWWGVGVRLHSESLLYRTAYHLPIRNHIPQMPLVPHGETRDILLSHGLGCPEGSLVSSSATPQKDVMMLTEGAIQSEGREGSHIFELKMYSNEVGGLKRCGQIFT